MPNEIVREQAILAPPAKLLRPEVESGDWGDAGPAEAVQLSLKERAVRGGLVIAFTQAAKFVLRLGAMMVLARLLSPADFGLVGMVTVVTGFLALFREAGLSLAAVQQDVITREQISTLFWINMLVGVTLAVLAVAMAPVLVAFYREPRLFWISVCLASGFIFSASAAQPQALLQRKLRFLTLAFIDVTSILASIVVGIVMAVHGYGLWALVGMAVTVPFVAAAGSWMTADWLPGLPVRGCGVGSMVTFGSVFTLNTVITYLAFNAEKMLLGRYSGAEALGLYGRAYQLVTLPTDQLSLEYRSAQQPQGCAR